LVISVKPILNTETYEITFDLGRFEQMKRHMLVAGTFNHWMTDYDHPKGGFAKISVKASTITITLKPGIYEYKYYDSASEEWMEIEEYPEIYRGYEWDYIWNTFGTKNCVLSIP